jgi:hypothetical protein
MHVRQSRGSENPHTQRKDKTVLINASQLKGLKLHAQDGDLGTVADCYFDDETWTIRYLTVETGGWLGGRPVLISPISVIEADWNAQRLEVALTMKQVENSPNIDTHKPVSRQHEAVYFGYYGYPYYWAGPYNPALYPAGASGPINAPIEGRGGMTGLTDTHLRSIDAVTGYYLEATDGEIGHVNGFLLDDKRWAIRYMEVATRNWWPGKKVLVSPRWIQRVSWTESKVFIRLTRDVIQKGPEYTESQPLTREYEDRLYAHYGEPSYWIDEEEEVPSLSMTAV